MREKEDGQGDIPSLGELAKGGFAMARPRETTKKRRAGFTIRPGGLSPKGSGPWSAFCHHKSRPRLTARQLPRIDGSPCPKGTAQRRDGAESLRACFETSCYQGGFLSRLLHDRAAAPLPSEGKAKKALLPPGCLPSNKMPGDHNVLGGRGGARRRKVGVNGKDNAEAHHRVMGIGNVQLIAVAPGKPLLG